MWWTSKHFTPMHLNCHTRFPKGRNPPLHLLLAALSSTEKSPSFSLSLFPFVIPLEMSSHTVTICEAFVQVRGSLFKEPVSKFVAVVFHSLQTPLCKKRVINLKHYLTVSWGISSTRSHHHIHTTKLQPQLHAERTLFWKCWCALIEGKKKKVFVPYTQHSSQPRANQSTSNSGNCLSCTEPLTARNRLEKAVYAMQKVGSPFVYSPKQLREKQLQQSPPGHNMSVQM